MDRVQLEICCGSLDDAVEAGAGGADRVELCSALFLGGLTPSYGALVEAKRRLTIPVIVMARPRGGGFCYTATEMAAKMATGVPQANGEIAIEPLMDVAHVGEAVLHMAELPLASNVQFMTIMATKMPFVGRG